MFTTNACRPSLATITSGWAKKVELEDGDDEEAAIDILRAEINDMVGLEAGNERLRDQIAHLQEQHDRLGH